MMHQANMSYIKNLYQIQNGMLQINKSLFEQMQIEVH